MTRPIEYNLNLWCYRKEAAAMSGRDISTIDRWVKSGLVRTRPEPGGRDRLYIPDFMPPARLPVKPASHERP